MDASSRYDAVKRGMTREQVHALVGEPKFSEFVSEGRVEVWEAQKRGERACLAVVYAPDGRVSQVGSEWYAGGLPVNRRCTFE